MEPLPNSRILLVEDDPIQSEKTRAFLNSLGQTVILAENGDQAVERFGAERPDIVLMDVVLPGIDGFETTRRIRQLCGDQWVPIVYLTILGGSANLIDGLRSGGDDYLVKPVELDILEAKLRSVMRTLALYRALKDSRDQLARTNSALSHANRELEAFTYAVAHDLKAPLRAINGYSNLLIAAENDRLSDEGKDYLNRIVAGTEQMAELIDDLLEYSHLERVTPDIARIRVDRAAAALLDEFRAEIERTGAQIRIDARCRELTADRNALTLILRNLLGNALKFSAQARPPTIEIGCSVTGSLQRLWIRDNGIGFEMRHAERIFDLFQRLHRSENYPGTGIGLAIVRKAAQRMEGRAWAESTEGMGATFYVEWPIDGPAHRNGGLAL